MNVHWRPTRNSEKTALAKHPGAWHVLMIDAVKDMLIAPIQDGMVRPDLDWRWITPAQIIRAEDDSAP